MVNFHHHRPQPPKNTHSKASLCSLLFNDFAYNGDSHTKALKPALIHLASLPVCFLQSSFVPDCPLQKPKNSPLFEPWKMQETRLAKYSLPARQGGKNGKFLPVYIYIPDLLVSPYQLHYLYLLQLVILPILEMKKRNFNDLFKVAVLVSLLHDALSHRVEP